MDFKELAVSGEPEKICGWPKILQSYGFKSDAEALAYRGNPIDDEPGRPSEDPHTPLSSA